ncbi:hypothetical protein O7627_22400 [Solwaraspora sp. WMMD1047]|uniref:DUF3558 family protein n=1 Tax=Solwaraspora sp. WMMD1047 TaxID=3016102 RepID=UPI0024172719|nr:DUF3558 family protein [Solwaraspora sp. WMMD1047]MDG4832036.1 hypothetical protein [Solwaraspora sp. WMMD1047]
MYDVRGAAVLGLIALTLAATAGCGGADQDPDPGAASIAAPAAEETTTADAEPTAEPTAGPTVDACSLVLPAEAEQLAGTPLADPVPASQACQYTAPPSGPVAQVEVYVGDGAKKQLDIERQLGHDLQPISGAGDEAYIWVDGTMVFVSRSGLWFSIRLVRLDDPATHREPLESLARTAAGRI